MSDFVDRAVDSLVDVPARELEAAAVALEQRGGGLWLFHKVFRELAQQRPSRETAEERSSWQRREGAHELRRAISRLEDEDVEPLREAEHMTGRAVLRGGSSFFLAEQGLRAPPRFREKNGSAKESKRL